MPDESTSTSSDSPPLEVVLRLRHPGDTYAAENNDEARRRFWQPFIDGSRRRNGNDEPLEPATFEMCIRAAFSAALQSHLRSLAVRSVTSAEGQRRRATAAMIVVRTRIIGYSSLELGLTLEPIKKVVELFDGNYEYFVTFLGQYGPLSLQESLDSGRTYFGPSDPIAGQLFCDVAPDPRLKATFAVLQVQIAAQPSEKSATAEKARWLWVLSNTSLVVPTLLAAIYLYTILSRIHEREAQIDKAYQELIRVQLELIRTAYHKEDRPASAAQSKTPPQVPAPTP